jgi:hypothetical protein
MESESFSVGGKTLCKTSNQFDKNKTLLRYEFYQRGFEKIIYQRTAAGDLEIKGTGEAFPEQAVHEERLMNELKKIEEKSLSELEPIKTPCSLSPGGNCQTKARLFLAYSYLSGLGEQAKSFPLGVHASLIFNLSSHINVGVDASIHTKKIKDEDLTQSFFFAIGKYSFGDVKKCDRTLVPDLHLLAGLANEKYGKSKGSGFAAGAGGGLDIRITRQIALGTQVDYIGIKFKSSDDWTNYLGASFLASLYW